MSKPLAPTTSERQQAKLAGCLGTILRNRFVRSTASRKDSDTQDVESEGPRREAKSRVVRGQDGQ